MCCLSKWIGKQLLSSPSSVFHNLLIASSLSDDSNCNNFSFWESGWPCSFLFGIMKFKYFAIFSFNQPWKHLWFIKCSLNLPEVLREISHKKGLRKMLNGSYFWMNAQHWMTLLRSFSNWPRDYLTCFFLSKNGFPFVAIQFSSFHKTLHIHTHLGGNGFLKKITCENAKKDSYERFLKGPYPSMTA